MTKKTVLAVITATALSGAGFSQETAPTTIAGTQESKRNELGLNVAPAVSILLGASPYAPKFSLSYKRVTKDNKAWRFAGSYQMNWGDSWYNFNNFEIVSQTDSTQMRRYRQNSSGDRTQINVGYEWRKGKKKLKYFFGADLIVGNSSYSHYIFDQAFVLEKGNPYQMTSGNKGDTLYYFTPDYTQDIHFVTSESTDFIHAGISPFFGVTYLLSNRFSVSAQAGADVSYSYGKGVTQNHNTGTQQDFFSSSMDFNMAGIVNDLSLIYKF